MKPAAPSPTATTDWLSLLARRRLSIGLTFSFIVAVAIAYLALAPRVYRSESKLLVRLGRENATLDPTTAPGGQAMVAVPPSREEEINSIVEVMGSRAMLEAVVDRLGAEFIVGVQSQRSDVPVTDDGLRGWARQAYAQARRGIETILDRLQETIAGPALDMRRKAIRQLEKSIRVERVRRSNVVEASCDADSPAKAQVITATWVELFQQEHVRLNRAAGTREFFETKTAEARRRLAELSEQSCALKSSAGLTAPQEQLRLLAVRLSEFEADLHRVETEQQAAESRIETLRSRLAQLPATEMTAETSGIGSLAADTMRSQLYVLEMQESELAAKYTDEHPKLIEVRRKLAEARKLFSAEQPTRTQVTTAPNKVHQDMLGALLAEEAKLAALRAESKGLMSAIASTREEIGRLNQTEQQLAELTREMELAETTFKRYAAGLEEARMDEALHDRRISNISVIEQAGFDPRPVHPAAVPIVGLGCILGLIGGLAVGIIAERRDRRIYSIEDFEFGSGAPPLTAVPRFEREPLQPARN